MATLFGKDLDAEKRANIARLRSQYSSGLARDALDKFGGSPRNSSEEAWLDYVSELEEMAERYKGTPYYERFMSNPYLQWQDMDGMDPDAFSAAVNDRMNRGRDIAYDIVSGIVENRYNSSTAQVARDRAAGINDALSGDIAGTTPAAASGTEEVSPIPGVTQEQALAKQQLQLAERANLRDSGVASIQSLVSLAQSYAQFADLASVLDQRNLLNQGYDISNASADIARREALKQSFLDTFVNSIPASEKFDPATVMDSFPRGNYKPDELAVLDELVNSGFFFSKDGTPSLALNNAYTGGVARSAENIEAAARFGNRIGGKLLNLDEGVVDYLNFQGAAERYRVICETGMLLAQSKIAELQVAMSQYQNVVAFNEARASDAVADAQISGAEYSQELMNQMTGIAQRRLEQRLREASEIVASAQSISAEFDEFVTKHYFDATKASFNGTSTAQAWMFNQTFGTVTDGYKAWKSNTQTMFNMSDILNKGFDLLGRYRPSASSSSTVTRNISFDK